MIQVPSAGFPAAMNNMYTKKKMDNSCDAHCVVAQPLVCTGVPRSQETAFPEDSTAGLCLGPYGSPCFFFVSEVPLYPDPRSCVQIKDIEGHIPPEIGELSHLKMVCFQPPNTSSSNSMDGVESGQEKHAESVGVGLYGHKQPPICFVRLRMGWRP